MGRRMMLSMDSFFSVVFRKSAGSVHFSRTVSKSEIDFIKFGLERRNVAAKKDRTKATCKSDSGKQECLHQKKFVKSRIERPVKSIVETTVGLDILVGLHRAHLKNIR